jgi:hypothetical protein
LDLPFQVLDRAPTGILQRPVDDLPRRHGEAAMLRPEPLREGADHLVVRPALSGGLDELRAELEILVPAALIEVVVLHEHGGGEYHVRHERGLGQELLVDAYEEVVTGEAAFHELLLRGDGDGIGVLDQHRRDRRAASEGLRVSREHPADL